MDGYTLTNGTIVTDDGRTSIPRDTRNADYVAYLAATGKTAEADAVEAAAITEAADVAARSAGANRVKAARSGRAKLIALGLTRPELRALGLTDPDPE